MKRTLATALLLTACAAAQNSDTPKPEIAQAIQGARHVRDYMKDPESFRVNLVTVVQDKKGLSLIHI